MNFFYQSRVESFSSFLSNDNTYPAHLHRQVEIMYVLSGELEISVEQQVYYLHKDDILSLFLIKFILEYARIQSGAPFGI